MYPFPFDSEKTKIPITHHRFRSRRFRSGASLSSFSVGKM